MSELAAVIERWDGKSAEAIRAVYARFGEDEGFSAELLPLLSQPTTEVGATWLLKHFLEKGNALTPQQIRIVVNHLRTATHWEATLHLLQSLHHFPIEASQAQLAADFALVSLMSENKFVRAWAYSAYYTLAQTHPTYLDDATQRLNDAMAHEAASVKARLRNVIKLSNNRRK